MSTAPKFTIRKAEKGRQKLRLGIVGPTGSGKTYTALIAAEAFVEGTDLRIGCIDSERESSELYADEFDFDVIQLTESHNPQEYIDALSAFAAAGNYGVVIVDSLSHAWMGKDGSLETVDKLAIKDGGGFGAWRKVTPMHNKLVDALLGQPYHVIATLRSKMEYAVEKDEAKGKTTVRKIGLAPVQRDGMEYEFTVVCEMNVEHDLMVGKTRFRKIDGQVVNKPRHEFFRPMREWIESGAPDRHASAEQVAEIRRLMPLANLKPDVATSLDERLSRGLTHEKADEAITKLRGMVDAAVRGATEDVELVKRRYFALLGEKVPDYDNDVRHDWQKRITGKFSTKLWGAEDFEKAIAAIGEGDLPIKNGRQAVHA